jgi:hypothetical protein
MAPRRLVDRPKRAPMETTQPTKGQPTWVQWNFLNIRRLHNVMITIFSYFQRKKWQFSWKPFIWKFFSASTATIKIKIAHFFSNLLGENIFQNHNIGPKFGTWWNANGSGALGSWR